MALSDMFKKWLTLFPKRSLGGRLIRNPSTRILSPTTANALGFPRVTAHINAFNSWKVKDKGRRKQSISLQMRLSRHLRYALSAELRALWAPFGGIASQLNHIGVLLTLGAL